MPNNNDFRSLNPETGLLEDPEEVREVAALLTEMVVSFLVEPFKIATMPPGLRFDATVSAVLLHSMLVSTSQAQLYRNLSGSLGVSAFEIERQIRDYGLSEVYPFSSSKAVKVEPPDMTALQGNDLLRTSGLLRQVLAEQAERASEMSATDQTGFVNQADLPASVEQFLHGLTQGDGNDG